MSYMTFKLLGINNNEFHSEELYDKIKNKPIEEFKEQFNDIIQEYEFTKNTLLETVVDYLDTTYDSITFYLKTTTIYEDGEYLIQMMNVSDDDIFKAKLYTNEKYKFNYLGKLLLNSDENINGKFVIFAYKINNDNTFDFCDMTKELFNMLIIRNLFKIGIMINLDEIEEADNLDAKNSNLETLKLKQKLKDKNLQYSEYVNYSRKILQKSNIVRINLNEKLFSILPYSEGMTSSNIINTFRGRLPDLINEFVIIKDRDMNFTPQIKNLNYEFEIRKNQDITLISKNTYRQIINNYDAPVSTTLLNDIKESDAVRVYYDNKLRLVLAPKNAVSNYKIFNQIIDTD